VLFKLSVRVRKARADRRAYPQRLGLLLLELLVLLLPGDCLAEKNADASDGRGRRERERIPRVALASQGAPRIGVAIGGPAKHMEEFAISTAS